MARHTPDVPNTPGWFCPKCGGHDLRVKYTGYADIHQDFERGSYEAETLSKPAWSPFSKMQCTSCRHKGIAKEYLFSYKLKAST